MTQTQEEYWNADAGTFWAEEADRLDGILAPFNDVILSAFDGQAPDHLVDVGCGAGALTVQAAQRLSPRAATGLDLSRPMLEVARKRAAAADQNIDFVAGDATQAALNPPVDAMISRYGIMFFEDPVEAFTALRAKMTLGGPFSAVCWQEMPKNAWLSVPLMATIPLLKEPPSPPDPHAPGPFAFADKDRTAGLLKEAGWSAVSLSPWEGTLRLPGDSLDQVGGFMTTLGPVASLIRDQELDPEPIKEAIKAAIEAACGAEGPFDLPAAAWHIEARA